jgi:hypothetical protein
MKKYQSDRKARRSRDTSQEYSTVGGITSLYGERIVEYLSAFRAQALE